MLRRCCFAVVVCSCVRQAGADWPQFRGPTGNGISTATGVPVQWSVTDHVEWKTSIPGGGWSSPVVAGDKIYLTSAVPEESAGATSLRALCVDAIGGQVVWNVEVFRPDAAATRQAHAKNSLASPTPIVMHDRLFVHFGHMGTAALDLNGAIIWRQQVAYAPVHGNGGSPVLHDEILVFNCDGAADPFVVALDQASGEVRWKTPRNTSATKTFSFSTPLVIEVDGRPQIVSPGSGFVAAYDPRDGREIWRVNYGEGYSVVPRPVYAHGRLFAATGFNKARLLAIDPSQAKGDAAGHVVWSYDRGVSLTPSIVSVGDELYFVADNGVATCLDAHTGKHHWSERLEGDFSSSPVYAEGRVYFTNEAGTTYVVKADKSFALLAANELGARTLASPAVFDRALLLRTETQLWRIGE